MAVQYKIRFKKPAQVERAYADKAKGGFWIDPIEVGTEMTVNEASYRFWDRKGVIDLVAKIDQPGVVNPFMDQQARQDPFAFLGAEPKKPAIEMAAIRESVASVRKAIIESDRTAMHAALTALASDDVAAALPGISEDSHMLIETALDDLVAGKPVDEKELVGALDEISSLIK